MSRQSDGDDGAGAQRGVKLGKIAHGAVQFDTVVQSLAKHDLRAEGDSRLGKAVEIGKHLTCTFVFHHLYAQFGVGGVYRYVDGGDVHGDQAFYVGIAQIGERDVVAVQKGETVVVVLKIERFAHSFWKLIDKAEHATVCAGVLFIHQGCFKFKIDIVVFALVDADCIWASVAQKRQMHGGIGQIKAVIQHVADLMTVDRHQRVVGKDARTRRDSVGENLADLYHGTRLLSLLIFYLNILFYHIFIEKSMVSDANRKFRAKIS